MTGTSRSPIPTSTSSFWPPAVEAGGVLQKEADQGGLTNKRQRACFSALRTRREMPEHKEKPKRGMDAASEQGQGTAWRWALTPDPKRGHLCRLCALTHLLTLPAGLWRLCCLR